MDWKTQLLGGPIPAPGASVDRFDRTFSVGSDGVLRDLAVHDPAQEQTRDMFAFKWAQRVSYGSEANALAQRAWLLERYGDLGATLGDGSIVLDAGCGAGYAADLLFRDHLRSLRYVGADISTAVDIASETLAAKAGESLFLQGDLMALPFAPGSFDLVLSEGVMHHTPSTREALLALARLVKPGGRFAFYVYALKAPVREYTDDLIRSHIANMAPEAAWAAMRSLTALGQALGQLDAEIDIPDDVELLGIPKGKISVQRLFYYYVCKAYYRPDYSFEEMNHINFDWFTPKYCHRQTPGEVRDWCAEAGLAIESLKTELSGITVIARKT